MDSMFNFLSQFAQSWAILGMAVFFVAAVLWAFRPGSKAIYDEAANSIFRHDSNPVSDGPARDLRADAGRP